MKYTDGGVCAPLGFKAAGIHCGIRHNRVKKDLALIVSEVPCACAGLFTRNRVKAAPVLLDMETVKSGRCQAIIANSGIANACAPGCMEAAEAMQKTAAEHLSIPSSAVLVGSTGVIGQPLDLAPIEAHMEELIADLSHSAEGSDAAANAIMTTDTVKKEAAVEFELAGHTVHIGGISKGSGMIHPNMGTMLCYLTTDCSIRPDLLKKSLKSVCDRTFNRISVDGDTSTNDSLLILANGMADNSMIVSEDEDFSVFTENLLDLCTTLARNMAKDGEGAKHLITCTVSGAKNEEQAEGLAKSVISSTLTKAAIFGCDANWGRVLCAMGYSGIDFDTAKTDICFSSSAGRISVCKDGCGLAFDEDLARKILEQDEVVIEILLHEGDASVTCWGCDITYDYIKINGDYRT